MSTTPKKNHDYWISTVRQIHQLVGYGSYDSSEVLNKFEDLELLTSGVLNPISELRQGSSLNQKSSGRGSYVNQRESDAAIKRRYEGRWNPQMGTPPTLRITDYRWEADNTDKESQLVWFIVEVLFPTYKRVRAHGIGQVFSILKNLKPGAVKQVLDVTMPMKLGSTSGADVLLWVYPQEENLSVEQRLPFWKSLLSSEQVLPKLAKGLLSNLRHDFTAETPPSAKAPRPFIFPYGPFSLPTILNKGVMT